MPTMIFNKKNPCPRCHHPEYELLVADDGRPRYKCTKCEETWTSGKSGGEFLKGKHRSRK